MGGREGGILLLVILKYITSYLIESACKKGLSGKYVQRERKCFEM